MPLTITSSAFEHGQPIPQRDQCEVHYISPPLPTYASPLRTGLCVRRLKPAK